MKFNFLKLVSTISVCFLAWVFMPNQSFGQKVIKLINPSFEGPPSAGQPGVGLRLSGWFDCGSYHYTGQTPPDIHPTGSYAWSVDSRPQQGNTFLGMVVRYDDTHEFVGQTLSSPLLKDKCYSFSCYLSMSDVYLSPTNRNRDSTENFTTPTVLRIWGGNTLCEDKAQLLAESEPISNLNWKPYFFKLSPKFNYKYIILEVFYKTPVLFPYNGHLLLDNCSDITEIDCDKPMEEIVAEMDREETERVTPDIAINTKPSDVTVQKAASKPNAKVSSPSSTPDIATNEPKEKFIPKLLPELNSDRMSKGQTFQLKNLYFKADSSRITDESFEVLDELATFLQIHEDIIIEIGGHTAASITPSYAKRLSLDRAKEVTDYLMSQGVSEDQLKYEGYGVEKPIVADDRYSFKARQKNQRVEIKVLSIRGDG